MNRIENKKTIADSAKLFEEEVLELKPDIPRKELCDMVDEYIYYQTDDVRKKRRTRWSMLPADRPQNGPKTKMRNRLPEPFLKP